ncbi:RNA methyltransferase tRNA(m5U54)methyltransferase [Tilletia horrida]|uniref:tRNA (guanine(26)-N(2))-dimethyltransferase n=1 Tax=Tilletia horrida TaxID=155126 RepID=A0AAN6GAR4_9BASI|nr:RNA methyltransferase tRNA(m5U54)methyltransferase [Tilletia horrida]
MAPTPIPLDPELARRAGIHLQQGESAFRENSTTIILPTKDVAFLNPVQEFNRDLSTLVIRTWGNKTDAEKRQKWEEKKARREAKIKAGTWTKDPPFRAGKRRKLEHADGTVSAETTQPADDAPAAEQEQSAEAGEEAEESTRHEARYTPFKFTVLEALAATGLRSIRYAKEIPKLRWVLANDLSSTAVDTMKRNLALNFPADRTIEEWKPDPNNPTTSTVAATIAAQKAAKAGALKAAPVAPTPAAAAPTPITKAELFTLSSEEVADLEEAVANGDDEAAQKLAAWRKAGAHLAQDTASPMNVDPTTADSAPPDTTTKVYTPAETARRQACVDAGINPDCKVRPHEGDAIVLQYMHRDPAKRFNVVDLDPYGSASSFIDGAVQAVADGGLLCVTCTDLAILAGNNYPEKCFSQYGGVNVRSEFSHEAALRLVLHTISTSAARYSRYIRPLLSLSIDFYLRVFVEVRTSAMETKRAASKTGIVHVCSQCQNFHAQHFGKVTDVVNEKRGTTFTKYGGSPALVAGPDCTECGGKMQTAGPMWLGPIHDSDFCRLVLSELEEDPLRFHTAARIKGMVTLAANELEDSLFYFTPSKMSGLFHCENPTLKTVVSTLLNAGFSVSRSHCAPGSLKTTATRAQCFDLFRSWIEKRSPVVLANIKAGSPSRRLMGKGVAREALLKVQRELQQKQQPSAGGGASAGDESAPAGEGAEAPNSTDPTPSSASSSPILNLGLGHGAGPEPLDFTIVDEHERAEEVLASGEKLVRYQMNPLPNWGPGKAARVNNRGSGSGSGSGSGGNIGAEAGAGAGAAHE